MILQILKRNGMIKREKEYIPSDSLLFILRKSSFIKECHLTHRIRLVRRWKSGKIENRKYMNKWRDKRDFSFLYLYLVGRWKSGEIKK